MSVEYSSGDFESQDSQESEYAPSATPDSEDYTSYESSSLETPSESSASIACSENVSQEIFSD